MKISCIQENLKHGLSLVHNITTKNVNLPILNNVLVDVQEDGLTLSTTNLEIGIRSRVRGKIEQTGSFTVESKLLLDYISLLPKERVDIELVDNNLLVNCDKNHTQIKGLPASDFPVIPQLDKGNAYVCKAKNFKDAISQVIFATAKNETRPEISGIYLKFDQGSLTATATDSYRLAERVTQLEQESNQATIDMIVPVRTLHEVVRILSSYKEGISNDDRLYIYVGEGQILFVFDEVEIVSRLIEGQYPDYKQIIPEKHETEIIVNVNELSQAVKAASLFSKSGINDISLEFIPPTGDDVAGNIKVSAVNDQVGQNETTLVAHITGIDNRTVLNYHYLLDGLSNINTQEVKIALIDHSTPVTIEPTGKQEGNDSYLYIVMPIRQ
jgi:DNA polymerase-3 subunit beta